MNRKRPPAIRWSNLLEARPRSPTLTAGASSWNGTHALPAVDYPLMRSRSPPDKRTVSGLRNRRDAEALEAGGRAITANLRVEPIRLLCQVVRFMSVAHSQSRNRAMLHS